MGKEPYPATTGTVLRDGDALRRKAGRSAFPCQDSPEVHRHRTARVGLTQGPVHFRTHLVTAPADGRPQVKLQIPGRRAERFHDGQSRFQDPGGSPPPPGMKQGNDPTARRHQRDGHAISRGHGQQDACPRGGMAVALSNHLTALARLALHDHAGAAPGGPGPSGDW